MSEKISIQDIDGKPISGQYVVRNGIVMSLHLMAAQQGE
jgi:hypothetical protein